MVVGFTTTRAISTYHNQIYEFEPRSWRDLLDTKLCDNVYQFATGRWFSPGTPDFSTDKLDRYEVLLKVALNTINKAKNIAL